MHGQNHIKFGLVVSSSKIGCEGVKMADRLKTGPRMENTIMKLTVLQAVNFLTRRATISFQTMTFRE